MTTPQLTAERALELAELFSPDPDATGQMTVVMHYTSWKELAVCLLNYAAALQECERVSVAPHSYVDDYLAIGHSKFACNLLQILTRSPSEPHDASPSTGDSQA